MSDSAGPYKLTLTGDGIAIEKQVDQATAMQVVALAFGAPGTGEASGASTSASASASASRPARRKTPKRAASSNENGGSKQARRRRSGAPGIVKDLSMRPAGKKSFVDFAAEKAPSTHQEKQAVIVYWLIHEAGLESGITVDHVNTCYQEAHWPRPTDLANALSVTAMRKGWLDSSDRDDIKLTTRGEDMVEHDLPKPAKK